MEKNTHKNLLNAVLTATSATLNDSGFVVDKNNCTLAYDESINLSFGKIINLKTASGWEVECDGIEFYGDGSIEFHETCEEAFHWSEYTEMSIEKVIEELKNI